MQPLANGFRRSDDESEEFVAPLEVALCPSCGLSQLTVVVDPKVLYTKDYPFVSGATPAWHDHCTELVAGFGVPGAVLDIAANDGTLLRHFRNAGWGVVGVDPASTATDLRIYPSFWSHGVAKQVVEENGPMNLIVAQNVLGHVNDPVGFLGAARSCLAPDGKIVVEVPDAEMMLANLAFDTIYHEHLSYWTEYAMRTCAAFAGLRVAHVEQFPNLHGGTKRYWMVAGDDGGPLSNPPDTAKYAAFASAVQHKLAEHSLALDAYRGKVIGAYGASAKGMVFLNALRAYGHDVWPSVIVDDAPSKQGLLAPGVRIPVVEPAKAMMESWDVCWVLSWNWREGLEQKAKHYGFAGEFL